MHLDHNYIDQAFCLLSVCCIEAQFRGVSCYCYEISDQSYPKEQSSFQVIILKKIPYLIKCSTKRVISTQIHFERYFWGSIWVSFETKFIGIFWAFLSSFKAMYEYIHFIYVKCICIYIK